MGGSWLENGELTTDSLRNNADSLLGGESAAGGPTNLLDDVWGQRFSLGWCHGPASTGSDGLAWLQHDPRRDPRRRTPPFHDAQHRRDTRFARSSATVFVFVKIGQPRSAPKGFDDRIAVGSGKRGHVQGGSDGCTSAPDLALFVREAVERVEMGRFQVNARVPPDAQYHPRMMPALRNCL